MQTTPQEKSVARWAGGALLATIVKIPLELLRNRSKRFGCGPSKWKAIGIRTSLGLAGDCQYALIQLSTPDALAGETLLCDTH